jgi:hypothetical protein
MSVEHATGEKEMEGKSVAYDHLFRQFTTAPPGKLYCVHGTGRVFRLSLAAVAQILLAPRINGRIGEPFTGRPVALVDGTNRFDVHYLAEFARRLACRPAGSAGARHDGRRITPEDLLDRIFVSRAFTCYQMEAAITERLPAFLRRSGSSVAVIFGLLDTFYDEQAPFFEVSTALQRIITALQRLRDGNVAVLLASRDVTLASKERNGLFPVLLRSMDRVFHMVEAVEGRHILNESAAFRPLPGNGKEKEMLMGRRALPAASLR